MVVLTLPFRMTVAAVLHLAGASRPASSTALKIATPSRAIPAIPIGTQEGRAAGSGSAGSISATLRARMLLELRS